MQFAIVDEAYPYISKRLLTDESPRLRAALRYMVYGKTGTFDSERMIDMLTALEKFVSVKDYGDGTAFKVDGVRGETALGAQQKDNNFMTRVTKSHSTVLDPTSQLKHMHPSKHTTIKDWKFGLGLGKDPDIIDMMAAKYPSVAKDFGDPEAEVKAQIEAESRRGRQEGGGVGASLAAPQSAEVAAMAAEAKERGEVVDQI